jgi:predicted aldo/keto reductase-like oxidoreductase
MMNPEHLSRRQFLEQAALAAGVLALGSACQSALGSTQAVVPAPATNAAAKRTASDIVELGKTGLKCTRLGLGLGSNNGRVQTAQGQEGLNTLIKHAFDQGITLLDVAQSYVTFNMLGAAIKGLPREKLFIQSKIEQPRNVLATIDNHRKVFNTDYVDSMLIHIQYRENWTETWKAAMDDFNAALDKKWIKSKGVSCHSLPALRTSITSDWNQVHLVRVNPQGYRLDSERQVMDTGAGGDIKPVVTELKRLGEKGRGVIGMKIYGDGQLKTEEERAKSLRFAMSMPEIHAIVIGFNGIDQFDQAYKLLNKVLAEPAA